MLAAVENCTFAEEAKLKYIASTTHLEVQKGILASKNAKSRSICYKRVFAKLPTLSRDGEEKRIIGRYFDVDAEGNIGANEKLIRELRKDVLENRLCDYQFHCQLASTRGGGGNPWRILGTIW